MTDRNSVWSSSIFPHGRWLGGFTFDHTTAHAPGPFLAGYSKGDPIEPVVQQAAIPQHPRFLDKEQECRLECVLRSVLVAQGTLRQTPSTIGP